MTCPTCNGPLANLFTSSYCPKCEAREAEKPVSRLANYYGIEAAMFAEFSRRFDAIANKIAECLYGITAPTQFKSAVRIKRTTPPGLNEDEE